MSYIYRGFVAVRFELPIPEPGQPIKLMAGIEKFDGTWVPATPIMQLPGQDLEHIGRDVMRRYVTIARLNLPGT